MGGDVRHKRGGKAAGNGDPNTSAEQETGGEMAHE